MKQADIGKRIVAYIIDSLVVGVISNIISIPLSCLVLPLGLFSPTSTTYSTTGMMTRSLSTSTAAYGGVSVLVMCCIVIVTLVLSLGLAFGYYIWYPVKKGNGATLGKKAMGMKVVRTSGAAVSMTDLFVREFIGKFFSGIVFYLGYIWILIDERGQGWHDKIADTLVVSAEQN